LVWGGSGDKTSKRNRDALIKVPLEGPCKILSGRVEGNGSYIDETGPRPKRWGGTS